MIIIGSTCAKCHCYWIDLILLNWFSTFHIKIDSGNQPWLLLGLLVQSASNFDLISFLIRKCNGGSRFFRKGLCVEIVYATEVKSGGKVCLIGNLGTSQRWLHSTIDLKRNFYQNHPRKRKNQDPMKFYLLGRVVLEVRFHPVVLSVQVVLPLPEVLWVRWVHLVQLALFK